MDLYYSPEKFGFKIFGEIEEDLRYEFDMLVVWERVIDNKLFYATDSGCSCPSPFENYNTVESLTPITKETFPEFEKAVMSRSSDLTQRVELVNKVRQLLK